MIAVIAAMDKEVDAIVSIMESHEHLMKSGIDFDKGILAGKELLVMKSGVGKGNAGMATTILLENFSIDCIVNIGTAGGLQVQQNILDAVQCGASRVGHGIALRGQKEAIRICRDRHIGIEMCPLSNMQTKAVKDPADYPIQEFLRENLLVTINTDNRMVSQTTLEKEFAFLREQYAVTREQEVQMTKNAIEVAFASDEVKAQLWKAMEL